ncbi:MAG: GntR family transcriptional regulator [Paracoccus sp. (in: a-proteobacteria)]|nr:GntR family transcriptional regulator [Paracoccus sp. (in: a-proteobacteria)]
MRPATTRPGGRGLNTWQSVRTEVLRRIRSGEWAPGSMIPTEQELSAELKCARATVNRALRHLAESGIIERRRKVGTRVAIAPEHRSTLDMPEIRDEIEATGAAYTFRMTSFGLARATPAAMDALHVDAGQNLLLIKTQHLADGRPHCCEAIWLNPDVLPDITQATFADLPVREWLRQNIPLTEGRFAILAESATGDCATNLMVDEGTPVLTIEMVKSRDATPIAFARQFYPPNHRLVSDT